MKERFKKIINLPRRFLNRIIDEEAKRVNELNKQILGLSPKEGGED